MTSVVHIPVHENKKVVSGAFDRDDAQFFGNDLEMMIRL